MGRTNLADARNPPEGFPRMARYLLSSKRLLGISREAKIPVEQKCRYAPKT